MNLTINEIAGACGGKIINNSNVVITSVSTHTTKITQGALFVPTVGEFSDGHDYINAAAESGAVCALTEKENITANIPLILVKCTRRALMDLAAYYRRLFNVKVVAVTGSAGKTTTKDMIYHVLSRKYKTKKTPGNFNNDIGLPFSIFQLEPDDEVLVLEMGMNHAMEIHELSLVGAPDIAVITHIGDAHIENFENREGILHAKLEIVDGLKQNGTVILNGDDPLLTGPVAAEKIKNFKVEFPGSRDIVYAATSNLRETRARFTWKDQDIILTVPLPGGHMVINALLAVAVGMEMGVDPEEISKGFDDFVPPDGRLTVENINNMTVINDAYNANPASMTEAIKILRAQTPRKVAILGDMNELGHVSEARHKEIGAFAAEKGIDLLISIGPMSRFIHENFKSEQNSLYFSTVDEFILNLWNLLRPEDVVLVKASRGMKFEQIIEALRNRKSED
jgi:UDP-N-acetylmuramoyl-tripeptide--D-alanyl-D-alanine ligase